MNLGGIPVETGVMAKGIDDARIIDKTVAAKFLTDDSVVYHKLITSALKNELSNGTVDLNFIRAGLRDADRSKFNECISKPTKTTEDLKEILRLAKIGFKYSVPNGAWSIISRRFVEATAPGSKIQSLVPQDINRNGIWGRVEVLTAMEKLPDNQGFGDKTIGELKAIREAGKAKVLRRMAEAEPNLPNIPTKPVQSAQPSVVSPISHPS